MTGTICINDDLEFDLSQGELARVAQALRQHTAAADARVMRELFWPMEEGGLDFLLADALDAAEFAVFATVVQRSHEHARRIDTASLPLWEKLLAAVHADRRYAANMPAFSAAA